MIRVLVADDQQLVRDGFRLMLEVEEGIEVVGEAPDGIEAVRLAEQLGPDVVLMDIRMPRENGLEATRRIAQRGLACRVLILTTYDSDEYLYQALRAGASGFVLKDARRADLVQALRTVAEGGAILHPSLTRRLVDRFAAAPAPSAAQGLPELTARENDVLRLVARGLNNAEISRELFVSESTAKTHVASILAKLGLRDRVQAVIAAYDRGLATPATPGS